ncbi:hypothetical protein SAMN04489712_10419 [Thermomonospora echinospora]|uniref:Uncharacterized protein n=1 Tax=Thermomonospora echinospora TaxID=1992 RepID=A0A1H5YJN5_9ACTN|nr:hypothetical protein [Thermomonospora echinospora]SEG23586.1 hypothetical protein SAMN04489712_10419 [Thermomonospora echinospora]
MTKFLLSVHVLAAILTIGPVAVAASLFPRYARQPAAEGADAGGPAPGVAAFLHRICQGYAVVGIAVPVFGFSTAAQLGVLTDAWLIASVVLTAIAAALLALAILPGQQRLLTSSEATTTTANASANAQAATRLTMLTGIFNLLWAIVVVLMIVRPGSTTGA